MMELVHDHEMVSAGDISVATIKVSSGGSVSRTAGAIAGQVRENGLADVQAIGADAVNLAIKAVFLAREFLAEDGIDAIFVPYFHTAMIGGKERTVVRLIVEPR
jgi:stage V sporulation protein S